MGKLDQTLAVLNGLVGDYLVKRDNTLATRMAFHDDTGAALTLDADNLRRCHPQASPRVVVLVHGLMCTETIWKSPDGSDYGSSLQRDLGFTPIYLRYNSGLPIPDNGAKLDQLLRELLAAYPVPITELLLLGYSMGGLIVRSACHFAAQTPDQPSPWLPLVKRAIYVGTPHLGAPAERAGRIVARILNAIDDPYTRLIADISNLRSAGVKGLGDAHVHDPYATPPSTTSLRDEQHPVPLLPGIRHHLIAGSLRMDPITARLFGDSLVPVHSATYGRYDPRRSTESPERIAVVHGTDHITLAHSESVYAYIKTWCEEPL